MATLTTEQYERWHKAMKAGDEKLAKEIEAEGYGGSFKQVIDAEIVEEKGKLIPTPDDIEAMRSEGMSDTEIGDQYGLSRQKISAIMKMGE